MQRLEHSLLDKLEVELPGYDLTIHMHRSFIMLTYVIVLEAISPSGVKELIALDLDDGVEAFVSPTELVETLTDQFVIRLRELEAANVG